MSVVLVSLLGSGVQNGRTMSRTPSMKQLRCSLSLSLLRWRRKATGSLVLCTAYHRFWMLLVAAIKLPIEPHQQLRSIEHFPRCMCGEEDHTSGSTSHARSLRRGRREPFSEVAFSTRA